MTTDNSLALSEAQRTADQLQVIYARTMIAMGHIAATMESAAEMIASGDSEGARAMLLAAAAGLREGVGTPEAIN